MPVKRKQKYAGIYDRLTGEYVCMDCYTDQDAYRMAVYLPIGGVMEDPCICVRCGEPLDLRPLGYDPKVVVDAVIKAGGA